MTSDALLQAILTYGLPTVGVVLLVLEIIVPRGRLRREEARGDKAMDIAEAQVGATRELAVGVAGMDTRLGSIETRLAAMEQQRMTGGK
jgi:hypothetical protein